MKWLSIAGQIAVLCGISLLGNSIAQVLNIGIPGSLIGMGMLFLLMERQWVKLEWIEAGANFLIAELLLFFIPAAIGVMQYKDLFQSELTSFLLVIVSSTILILLTAGALTELTSRHGEKKGGACS